MSHRGKKRARGLPPSQIEMLEVETTNDTIDDGSNNKSSTHQRTANSNLLVQLAECCNTHLSWHKRRMRENITYENEEDVPSTCRNCLQLLRKILPRVEKTYKAVEPGQPGPPPHPLDVRQMCDFYCNVISGGFCIHAPHVFRLGKGGSEVLPRAIYLLQHAVSKAVITHSVQDGSVLSAISFTLARLLSSLAESRFELCVVRDFVHMLQDLCFLLSYDWHGSDPQVEIELFSETKSESVLDNKSDFLLALNEQCNVHALQVTLLEAFKHFLTIGRQQRLGPWDESSEVSVSGYMPCDLSFALADQEMLVELLRSLEQLLSTPASSDDDEVIAFLSQRSSICALDILDLLVSDWNTGAICHSVVSMAHALVAKTAFSHFFLGYESASYSNPELSQKLSAYLQKNLSCSPAASALRLRRGALEILTGCLQFIYHGNRQVDEELSSALFSCLASMSGVSMPSYTDGDIRPFPIPSPFFDRAGVHNACLNLFCALHDPQFHHAALVVTLSVIRKDVSIASAMVKSFLDSFEIGHLRMISDESRLSHQSQPDAKRRKTCSDSRGEKNGFRFGLSGIFTEAHRSIKSTDSTPNQRQVLAMNVALHVSSYVRSVKPSIRDPSHAGIFDAIAKHLILWVQKERTESQLMSNTIANCCMITALLRSAESAFAEEPGGTSLNELMMTCFEELASFQIRNVARIKYSALGPQDILQKLWSPKYQSLRLRVIVNRTRHGTTSARSVADKLDFDKLTLFLESQDRIVRLLALESTAMLIECSKAPQKLRQFVRCFLESSNAEGRLSVRNRLISAVAKIAFCDKDSRTQYYTSRRLGKIVMTGSPPILLTALAEEAELNHVLAEDNVKTSYRSMTTIQAVTSQFFLLVDQLLHRYCEAPLSQLSLEESNEISTADVAFAPEDVLMNKRAALRSLVSICNACDVSTESGRYIFEKAIIRVERLWSASEQSTIIVSGLCFGELLQLFRKLDPHMAIRTRLLSHIAPPIFRDIFDVNQEHIEREYMILSSFLRYFPHQQSINDEARDAILIGSSSVAVEQALEEHLPTIFGQLVLGADIGPLRLMTGFKIFILHRKKLEEKGTEGGISPMLHLQRGDRLVWSARGRGRPWSRGLENQTYTLCIAPDIVERIVPVIFKEARSSHLNFFAKTVLLNKKDLSDVIRLRDQLMLKGFVRELGRRAYSDQSVRALKIASSVRAGGFHGNSQQPQFGGDQAASSWVSSSFMYILVNVVQFRWQQKKSYEKVEDLRSLWLLLDFLHAREASKYLPQVMTTLSVAAAQRVDAKSLIERRSQAELRVFAVLSMSKLVKIASLEVLAENLASIIVSLAPSLREEVERPLEEDRTMSKLILDARSHAVSLVNILAEGQTGRKLKPYFESFTFLFDIPSLQSARASLQSHGLEFGALQDLTQGTSGSKVSTQSDGGSVHGDNHVPKDLPVLMALTKNLQLTCSLISTEDSSVRREALKHLLNLLRQNKKSFRTLVDNESTAGAGNFLTKCYKEGKDNRGIVTTLIEALLARSVREAEDEQKRLIAYCLGEVGPISEHRLNDTIISASEDYTGEECHQWRLSRPPWATKPEEYQLRLVSKNLVLALRAATSSADQHKIGYSIQQLLVLLQQGRKKMDRSDPIPRGSGKAGAKGAMAPWLVEEITKRGVYQDVEPFWRTEFHETEMANKKKPPFLAIAPTYLGWISQWCRYMIASANDASSTDWTRLFHACRTSLRTETGLVVGEFLLPLLVLDRMCHGTKADEAMIVQEMKAALTLQKDVDRAEAQRFVNAVFAIIDTLNFWWEKDTENRHKKKRSSQRKPPMNFDWRQDEATMRIEDLLLQIPLELQAIAAQRVGMNVRSLRLMEIASRARISESLFGAAVPDSKLTMAKPAAPAGTCPAECLGLMKGVLASLDDYDTLISFARTDTEHLDTMNVRVAGSDWNGALEACERGLQLGSDAGLTQTFQEGALRCLLELGQYQSVLNQVRGIPSGGVYAPYAIEAAWRLGDWQTLSSIAEHVEEKDLLDHKGNFQCNLGKAILALHKKESPTPFLDAARSAAMEHLQVVGRDSYSRSYEQIVKLRSLQELQDFFDHNIISHEDWGRRLEVASPASAIPLTTVRLAIARVANDKVLEGRLLMEIGRQARKNRKYHIATTSLVRADHLFKLAKDAASISDFTDLQLERAKVNYQKGDSSLALRLLHLGDFESIIAIESNEEATAEAIRRASSIFDVSGQQMDTGEALQLYVHAGMKSIKWMVEEGLKGGHEVLCGFRTILRFEPKWEKAHFHYARYVETSMRSRVSLQKTRSASALSEMSTDHVIALDSLSQRYVMLAIQHYGEALKQDQKHLYLALPRLLSLYFSFTALKHPGQAAHSSQVPKRSAKQPRTDSLPSNQRMVNDYMEQTFETIPAQAFYSTIAQLISRTSHPNEETQDIVNRILSRVLTKFPEQALWRLAWLIGSKDKAKQRVGEDIFRSAQRSLNGNKNAKKKHDLLVASRSLFAHFSQLAAHPGPGPKTTKKNEMTVKPWVGEVPLTSFVPPVQAALSLSASQLSRSSNSIFMQQIPRMRTFDKRILVMSSKAKPKKVIAYATTGDAPGEGREGDAAKFGWQHDGDIGEIHFLVKQEAKGDLRKDARVQDFNNVVNRLMMSTSSTKQVRRRNLKVRTFAVTNLSEDAGIIEWVPDTSSLRHLITQSYNPQAPASSSKRRGKRMANPQDVSMKQFFENDCQDMYFKGGNLRGAALMFESICLRENPPVLFWWFVQNFPNAHLWLQARTRFTESAASWSAIGHLIGLGDRHSENILVTSRGEICHVDFDCLFDKGLNLPKPEVVPFRLTPNMIDAFGPVGADGIFKGSLEAAMCTLRNNRDTLLSVLEPFVDDPIIDWKRTRSQQQKGKAPETKDENLLLKEAKRSLNVIDERLRGIYNLRNPNKRKIRRTDINRGNGQEDEELTQVMSLSVEGQAQKLIAEATSSENLVCMYVGWMPWV